MSSTVRDEFLHWFRKTNDPEIEARGQQILEAMLSMYPQVKQRLVEKGIEEGIEEGIEKGIEKGIAEGIEKGIEKGIAEGIEKGIEKGIAEGRLVEARAALRRVLVRRRLALTAEDEARIEACADLATLERWHDQAITAASASEAMQ